MVLSKSIPIRKVISSTIGRRGMTVQPSTHAAWRFSTDADDQLASAFAERGYVIAPAEDRTALDAIRRLIADTAADHLGIARRADDGAFLDGIAEHVTIAQLNELRLAVIDVLAATPWFRAAYFATARSLIERIVGNELAMQRSLGFSIQLPDDESSLLPLHSDAWSEDSPYEVVLWIPFVDCFRTKSMFLLPPKADRTWRTRMAEFAERGVEALYAAVEPELEWLEIPYGNVLVFTHTMMHGNRINTEAATRWSVNIRFKGLFTPYSDKQLGDFFDPIAIRPASRVGLAYRLPPGFEG
jgi:sporadic carbohydrate cluster 2OG-Fe(II) oxygenase